MKKHSLPVRLKTPFETSSVLTRNANVLEHAKSAATSLKGKCGLEEADRKEADRELAILGGHIQDMLEGKNSYDQAENSLPQVLRANRRLSTAEEYLWMIQS